MQKRSYLLILISISLALPSLSAQAASKGNGVIQPAGVGSPSWPVKCPDVIDKQPKVSQPKVAGFKFTGTDATFTRLENRASTPSKTPDDLIGCYVDFASINTSDANGYHVGTISRDEKGFYWQNAAGIRWGLKLSGTTLFTDKSNPYYSNGNKFVLATDLSAPIVEQLAMSEKVCRTNGGLSDGIDKNSYYLQAFIKSSDEELMQKKYGNGFSWYSTLWPLFKTPAGEAQVGLASTWINPSSALGKNDSYFQQHNGAIVQTIEGSLGWWWDTAFRPAMPKYVPGPTINNYASGALDFWAGQPLQMGQGGWITVSNKILMPPEGMTFNPSSAGTQLGQMWLSLPLPKTGSNLPVKAGTNAWTLFLNSENFSGPIGYVEPNFWADSVSKYPDLAGQTFDNQTAYSMSLASEMAGVPYCRMLDASGVMYTRLPQMQFTTDAQGKFIFARDYRAYNQDAVSNTFNNAVASGSPLPTSLNSSGTLDLHLEGAKTEVFQGGYSIPSLTNQLTFQSFDNGLAAGFDFQKPNSSFQMPEYFKKDGSTLSPIDASTAPKELKSGNFSPKDKVKKKVMQTGIWFQIAGKPASAVIKAKLSDGSTVGYRWYKFIDQPELARFKLTSSEKTNLQKAVERMQKEWSNKSLQQAPSGGALTKFDDKLLVKPPKGLEIGYVPIVVSQVATK